MMLSSQVTDSGKLFLLEIHQKKPRKIQRDSHVKGNKKEGTEHES